MKNIAWEINYQLNSLSELIKNHYMKDEAITGNEESEKEYLLLANKLCELGSYHIIKNLQRYIFETHKDGIYVIDLLFNANNTLIPYDKILFSTTDTPNSYALLMSCCFSFTLTKEEAYSLYNIIKLKQMKYPYTISKNEKCNSYIIIDSTENEMAFFCTYEEANNFNTSSLTYINNVNETKIDDKYNQKIDVEEFLNT